MNSRSVVTFEKPLAHLSLQDWNARVANLRNIADARRKDAFTLRQNSRALQNETRLAGQWNTTETEEAMIDRVAELKMWRETIAKTFRRIEGEIRQLELEKKSTERELDALQIPLNIVAECLSMRDCRLGSELTYDEADIEVKNELSVIENNRRLLEDQCQKAWEKLSHLEDVRFKLNLEIDNKAEAEILDTKQLELDKYSPNITYKPDALRNPRRSCCYESWLQHTRNMKQMAENELVDAYNIREALFVVREKARNLLQAQTERADHALRKRIFETQRARNELQWQKLRMSEEMQRALCELKVLEDSLAEKTDALKLTETRLENRAQRSGMELCIDQAHHQLVNEAHTLREIRYMLTNQINDAKTNYNAMADHAQRIDVDIENKQHSLMTDIRAVDLRARLKTGSDCPPPTAPTQTERNIMLTRMEAQIPKN